MKDDKLRPLKWNLDASLEDRIYKKGRPKVEFDGYRLDYLHIDVEIVSAQDVEKLIQCLRLHKYCFTAGGKDFPINPRAGAHNRTIKSNKDET